MKLYVSSLSALAFEGGRVLFPIAVPTASQGTLLGVEDSFP